MELAGTDHGKVGRSGEYLNEKIYIQADRVADGSYAATEASCDFNDLLSNYEYGDVIAAEYQMWEYPSGKKYEVIAKTFTDHIDTDDFSTPNRRRWIPVINYIETDQEQVRVGYERLRSSGSVPAA